MSEQWSNFLGVTDMITQAQRRYCHADSQFFKFVFFNTSSSLKPFASFSLTLTLRRLIAPSKIRATKNIFPRGRQLRVIPSWDLICKSCESSRDHLCQSKQLATSKPICDGRVKGFREYAPDMWKCHVLINSGKKKKTALKMNVLTSLIYSFDVVPVRHTAIKPIWCTLC